MTNNSIPKSNKLSSNDPVSSHNSISESSKLNPSPTPSPSNKSPSANSLFSKANLSKALTQTLNNLKNNGPILLGVVMLIGLFKTSIDVSTLFTNNPIIDTLIGAISGSILAGNPITSYILGGELLSMGVSWAAITAFLISWVTVGIVQLPAESLMLGKSFAISRNLTAFLSSILIGIIVYFAMGG